MELSLTPLFYILTILVGILMRSIMIRSVLSYPVFLVLLGFVATQLIVHNGYDLGIRSDDFQWLCFYIFIPILIFYSSSKISFSKLLKELPSILYLSIPVLLLSLVIVAPFMFIGINHPSGFPWIAAVLTATMICATGSMPMNDLLQRHQVPDKIRIILDGESLLGNVFVIILFQMLLMVALMPNAASFDLFFWIIDFTRKIAGGIFVGIMIGGLGLGLITVIKKPLSQTAISIASAFLAYIVGQDLIQASGIIAVATTGLLFGQLGKPLYKEAKLIDDIWELIFQLAYACVFLLVGLAATVSMFTERYLAMLIAIVALLIARFIACFLTAPASSLLSNTVNYHERFLLFIGGTRDVIPVALALSLPTELDYWWTIQSIVFGVVIFSLLIKLPVANIYLKKSASQ